MPWPGMSFVSVFFLFSSLSLSLSLYLQRLPIFLDYQSAKRDCGEMGRRIFLHEASVMK